MQITWTNCSEQMPPDDESKLICRFDRAKPYEASGIHINHSITIDQRKSVCWCEFTPETWKELNK